MKKKDYYVFGGVILLANSILIQTAAEPCLYDQGSQVERGELQQLAQALETSYFRELWQNWSEEQREEMRLMFIQKDQEPKPKPKKDIHCSRSLLEQACVRFDLGSVEDLLDRDVSPEWGEGYEAELLKAINSFDDRSIELVRLLVKKGASLNGAIRTALTAYLSFNHKSEKIFALIDGGAQVNKKQFQGAARAGLRHVQELQEQKDLERALYNSDTIPLYAFLPKPSALLPIMSAEEWYQLERMLEERNAFES